MKQHAQAQARAGMQRKTRTPTNTASITRLTCVLLPRGLQKKNPNLHIPEHGEQKVIVMPCAINSSEEHPALFSLPSGLSCVEMRVMWTVLDTERVQDSVWNKEHTGDVCPAHHVHIPHLDQVPGTTLRSSKFILFLSYLAPDVLRHSFKAGFSIFSVHCQLQLYMPLYYLFLLTCL